jgi:adenylate kinase
MKAGGLVADELMLRLISHELQTRGWLFDHTGRPGVMTLNSEATNAESLSSTLEPSSAASFFGGAPPPGISASASSNADFSQPSDDPAASFILDGFPRTATQASSLEPLVPINLAVSLRTPFDIVLGRITGRWVHEPSGRVYNTTFNAPRVPGRDDVTGEPLIQRPDDSEEVYRTRFQRFQEVSEPLLEHYARRGVLVEVDGMSSDEISPKLYNVFEKHFC